MFTKKFNQPLFLPVMPAQRFSNTLPITKENLARVPKNKPGVYRIKNAQGAVLCVGKAKGGRLNERIAEHKGRFMRGTQFQYRITSSKTDVDKLAREEIMKHIPPRKKQKQYA